MKAIITAHTLVSDFVTTLWTPFFVALFVVIVAYAFWPRNRTKFDDAAHIPLRED